MDINFKSGVEVMKNIVKISHERGVNRCIFILISFMIIAPETIGQVVSTDTSSKGALSIDSSLNQDVQSKIKIVRQYLKDDKNHLALVTLLDLIRKDEKLISKLTPLIDKSITKTGTLALYLYDLNFLAKINSSEEAFLVFLTP